MIVQLFSIFDAPQAAFEFVRRHRTGAMLTTALLAGSLVIRTAAPAGAATITVDLPKVGASVPTQEMLEAEGRSILINAAMPFASAAPHPASPFVMTGSAEDQELAQRCMTQAIYYEAGYEPLTGRRAVAQVVLNRVRSSSFPNSICGVIYQGAGSATCQFTFVCTNDLSRQPTTAAWREADLIARAALSGYVEQSVGEATHYHANYVAPAWAPTLSKVAAIGTHIFYEWPRGSQRTFTQRYAGEPRDATTLRLSGFGAIAPVEAASVDSQPKIVAALGYHIDALLDAPAAQGGSDAQSATGALLH
jgi:spore germination cell wall hydrolase CwlJ-like protein